MPSFPETPHPGLFKQFSFQNTLVEPNRGDGGYIATQKTIYYQLTCDPTPVAVSECLLEHLSYILSNLKKLIYVNFMYKNRCTGFKC